MHTRFGTGTCSSASNFSLYALSIVTTSFLGTCSIHLWVVFVFAQRDSHNHFQVASMPSLLCWFSPNSSCQPHAVSISHDDLRRRRFNTQVNVILPHARQLPERSSCSISFQQDSFSKMPCLALLLICPSVSRTRSSRLVQPRTSSTRILRVLRSTAKWNASHQSSVPTVLQCRCESS